MRDITTKEDNGDSTLSAGDFNSTQVELEGLASDSGQTLDPPGVDTYGTTMLREAVAVYASTGTVFTDAGSGTLYTLSIASGLTAQVDDTYVTGMTVTFKANTTNTGASNINVSSIGEVDLLRADESTELVAGDIVADERYTAIYNGTAFVLQTGFLSTNLKMVAGAGIDFSANTPFSGMTSQLLDDYEEGTFTPILEAGGVDVLSGGSPWTTDLVSGQYTKVGNRVDFTITIRVKTKDASISGPMTVSGLPFVKGSDSNQDIASVFYHKCGSTDNIPFARVFSTASAITLTQQPQSTGSSATLQDTEVGSPDSQIAVTGTYFI